MLYSSVNSIRILFKVILFIHQTYCLYCQNQSYYLSSISNTIWIKSPYLILCIHTYLRLEPQFLTCQFYALCYPTNIYMAYLDGLMMPLTSFKMFILASWELHCITFVKTCPRKKYSLKLPDKSCIPFCWWQHWISFMCYFFDSGSRDWAGKWPGYFYN